MKRWVWVACLLGLLTSAEAYAQSCVTSAASWQNLALAAQTTEFTTEFDATPQTGAMDGVIGLSNGPATAYTSLAAIVRFNTAGLIDAVTGAAYAASAASPYSAGVSYHVRLVINLAAHTYSAYVKVGSGSEQLLASNFAFRTEQAAVTTLSNLSAYASLGSETVCLAAASPPAPPTPAPPPITGLLAWDASVVDATHGAALSYNVKCGTTSGAYPLLRNTTQTTMLLKDILSATGTYFCIVTGVNLAGESLPSNEVTFQIAAKLNPPAAPVLRLVP